MKNYQTIAVFRALKLGDMLCSIPSFRALRFAYPHANISLIGLPWTEEFAKRYPSYFDNFIPFPGYIGLPEQQYNRNEFKNFLKKVTEKNFDLLIQMHGAGTITNPLISLFSAKETAGFYQKGRVCPNEKTFIAYPKHIHEIQKNLLLLKKLGISEQGTQLEFPITSVDSIKAETLLKQHNVDANFIVMHPGASVVTRQYNPHKFAAIADKLTKKGFFVVFTGSETENKLIRSIQQEMVFQSVNLAGKTDLGTLASLLTKSKLVICNDTGVSHVAAAVKAPSVVIFVKSDYENIEQWRPINTLLHRAITSFEAQNPENVLLVAYDTLETLAMESTKKHKTNSIPMHL